ncbi:DNA-directed DNA polymerase [Citrus sinensis]|uniref:DNA-directed DNA polymerase n=1 Tax=Citrus sinensis TaxID=2711 RepID=A0ACB8MBG0_CITSI|nr:DNA-directed DNA polymerase [Citrus sinensis]
MAYQQSLNLRIHSFWRSLNCFRKDFSKPQRTGNTLFNIKRFDLARLSSSQSTKGSCCLSINLSTNVRGVGRANFHSVVTSKSDQTLSVEALDPVKCEESAVSPKPSNGRVMLIDGTSIIYRAYYKILAKLHHGHLSHADGNGDWVLTIFSALSLIIDVLEFIPSHVALDYCSFRRLELFSDIPSSFRLVQPHLCWAVYDLLIPLVMALQAYTFGYCGMNFRHTLYPSYKNNRPPTPDTIVQGLQYLKASIKAMSIKVIEVPGVEADDVIGTLAVRNVDAGFKTSVFQSASPASMASFGMEDFARKYGELKPSQFVDVISLVGDKADNIPGVEGIGDVRAVQLITKFGSLENLLQCVDQVEEERTRKMELVGACSSVVDHKSPINASVIEFIWSSRLNDVVRILALITFADQAVLSKNLALLRCDLPFYMVPFTTGDIAFEKPKFRGARWTLNVAYALGYQSQSPEI